MSLQNLCRKLYEMVNETEALDIASLIMNLETNDQLLIELTNGEKYKITIETTEEFI